MKLATVRKKHAARKDLRRSSVGPYSATVERQLLHAFSQAWPAILRDPRLARAPEISSPRIVPATPESGLLTVTLTAPHEISVSRTFTRTLSAEFRRSSEVLRDACLSGASPPHAKRLEAIVVASLLEVAAMFAILHEVFHVLGGHVAEYVASTPQALESGLGFEEVAHSSGIPLKVRRQDANTTAMLTAYYREVEADNNALQWIMQEVPLPPSMRMLVEVVSTTKSPTSCQIFDLPDGWGRIVCFRVLLTALIVTVRLLERRLGCTTRLPETDHPFPMARLFAGAFTILEQFAELTKARTDSGGVKRVRLSGVQAQDLKDFMQLVAQPVLSAPWKMRDMRAALDGFEAFGPCIIGELQQLLFGRTPSTEPARQVLRIQNLRVEMSKRLAPYRCFSAQ